MNLVFGSVCSGIEAASVAWKPLGWRCAFMSEIDKFARAVLETRYPDVPLHGDFTTIKEGDYEPIDVLVGGTRCQDFSIAGLRKGFAGDRGNLTFEFVHLLERLRPKYFVWENVPGCLSIDGGRGFGVFLGMLAKCGYGFAYRILDAQYFGLAQRRERVFVVGYLGDWRRAAAVLFERESVRWDPAPRREAGKRTAGTLSARTEGGGFPGTDEACDGYVIPVDEVSMTLSAARGTACANAADLETYLPVAFGGNSTASAIDVATALNAHVGPHGRQDFESETFIAQPVAFKASHYTRGKDGAPQTTTPPLSADADKGDQDTLILAPKAYRTAGDGAVFEEGDTTAPLTTQTDPSAHIIAFSAKDHGADASEDISPTLRAGGHHKSHANAGVMPAVCIPLQEIGKRTGKSTTDVRAGIGIGSDTDPMFTLQSTAQHGVALGFETRFVRNGRGAPDEIASPLKAQSGTNGKGDGAPCVAVASAVRRLTPVECCRLQGFVDDYLDIMYRGKPAADGPKYKTLGNSMATPVMAWIGKRIEMVETMTRTA